METGDHTASWDRGELAVTALGAMCAPASLRLDDGRMVQPFGVAPWADERPVDPRHEDLPPLLRRLRGDWACLPFGMPSTRDDLPSGWAPSGPDPAWLSGLFHGPSANLEFRLTHEAPGLLELTLDYPKDHPILRIRRSVYGVPGRPRIEFGLEVWAREDVELPVGVHPVFRLPRAPGAAELAVAGDIRVHTYPVDAEPGVSRLVHGEVFANLQSGRTVDGDPVDLSRHPLPFTTEEIVLVSGTAGHASLTNHEEAFRVDLTWDPTAFPSCNLWISNGGRTAYPWNGRHVAIGIEPVAAPFDLGAAVAVSDTALHRRSVATAARFKAGEVWSTNYAIEVSHL